MEFCIKREELLKALADLDKAATNGFEHAESVFTISAVGPHLHQCQATYGSPLMRAHKDDEKKNWGRFPGWDNYQYADGRLQFKDEQSCSNPEPAPTVDASASSIETPR